MAVTIHTTPEDFTPSDNPVQWTFSSDQTAQPNFYYLVKVYVNDVLYANEGPIYPESGIYARYDASHIASDNCNTPTISDDIVLDANNYCKIKITVVERYGDPVADGASTAASNITCWKASMRKDDFVDWDASDYIPTGGADGAWITNYPTYPKVKRTAEEMRLLMINNENSVTLVFKLYDSAGSVVATDTYGFTATSYELLIVNCTPSVIVTETSITSANFTNSAYYTVSTTGVLMPEYRIDLSDDCTYDTYKRIHFLSSWGSIESYSFNLITRFSGDVKSHGYEKNWGEWNGNAFQRTKEQGTVIDFAKEAMIKQRCISDWLPQSVQNYFQIDLKASPLVYVEDPVESLFVRRRVTNKTIEWKIQENDMLFLEQLDIDVENYQSATI